MRMLTVGLLAITSILAACSPAAIASLLPAAGPLVTVSTRGGECPDGPCGLTLHLGRDGRVQEATKPPNEIELIVPAVQVAAIEAAIGSTDFAALRSRKFTGECPTAFDGQEFVFEFDSSGGLEQIASCAVEIDYSQPLFVAVGAALGSLVALP